MTGRVASKVTPRSVTWLRLLESLLAADRQAGKCTQQALLSRSAHRSARAVSFDVFRERHRRLGGYGLDVFIPTLLKESFPHMSSSQLGFLAAVPPLTAMVVMN
jgi:hypothetical protein